LLSDAVIAYVPSSFQPAPPLLAPKDKDTASAARLCRRLAAIQSALADLQHQARRYARLMAPHRAKRQTVLRRGQPPGLRETSGHEVHEILKDCDWMARTAPLRESG